MGVGGGVACLTDDALHISLGDVVVSHAEHARGHIYVHCHDAEGDPPKFKVEKWGPSDPVIRDIVARLHHSYTHDLFQGSQWQHHMVEASQELKGGDTRFERPPPDTNKPYKVKNGEEIEFEPPLSPLGSPRQKRGEAPLLHLGVVGAGKVLGREDNLRDSFTDQHAVCCVDTGFQAVMDSIDGNRKDSFVIVRGVADYRDGMHRREWQGYAALAAAAVMKAIVLELPSQTDSDDED